MNYLLDLAFGFQYDGWKAWAQVLIHMSIILTVGYAMIRLAEFHKQGLERLRRYDLRQENKK